MQLRHGTNWSDRCSVCRPAMILGGEVGFILTGNPRLLKLLRPGVEALLMCRSLLRGCWTYIDAAPAAVVANAVYGCLVDDGAINVSVMNDGGVHMHDRGVVAEIAAIPASAIETGSVVAVAVIHTAIEADLRAPVSGVPEVGAVTPAPVPRSPEQAYGGGKDPRSGYPIVIADSIPGPIARCPQIVGPRTDWLLVDGQLGRGHGD